jgi:peroxiredoxin
VLQHYDEIRQRGGEVLVVTFTRPERIEPYLARHPLPVPVVSDPSLKAYRALDLGRTSWWALLRPGVIVRYLKQMLRGWLPEKPNEEEDLLQLGGDFVLDAQQRLAYLYRSTEPTDRPSAATVLEALRAVAGAQ